MNNIYGITLNELEKYFEENGYKKFKAVEGNIWSHLEPRNKSDIIEQKNGWYKTTVEVYLKSLKICYANDSGYNQAKYGMPNRKNPYSFVFQPGRTRLNGPCLHRHIGPCVTLRVHRAQYAVPCLIQPLDEVATMARRR